MSEVCEALGVSRKTGYKWLARYERAGLPGLADRSRAPKQHPNAMAASLAAVLLAARRAHPRWRPRKLLAWVGQRHRGLVLPAPSTVGALLEREGGCTLFSPHPASHPKAVASHRTPKPLRSASQRDPGQLRYGTCEHLSVTLSPLSDGVHVRGETNVRAPKSQRSCRSDPSMARKSRLIPESLSVTPLDERFTFALVMPDTRVPASSRKRNNLFALATVHCAPAMTRWKTGCPSCKRKNRSPVTDGSMAA